VLRVLCVCRVGKWVVSELAANLMLDLGRSVMMHGKLGCRALQVARAWGSSVGGGRMEKSDEKHNAGGALRPCSAQAPRLGRPQHQAHNKVWENQISRAVAKTFTPSLSHPITYR